MNIRDLYNLIEMIPDAALEYIANRMVGAEALTNDEIGLLSEWISKKDKADHDQTTRSILLSLTYKNIKYISNPSEDEQLKVVSFDPLLIAYLGDPSENVQMAALSAGSYPPGKIFGLVENPSNALVIAHIQANPLSILDMKNITVEQQCVAVQSMPTIINDYRAQDWSDDAKSLAFELDPKLFQFVTNPSEEQSWAALYDDVNNLKYIKNPTDEMRSFAIIVA